MKTNTLGLLFLIIGIVMIIYTGFDYVTTKEVAEIGPITILTHKKHNIPFSPIIGLALITIGILTISYARIKKTKPNL